ncbi:hypothetical protein PSAC2689_10693 [Paraburkholderia sacchari]
MPVQAMLVRCRGARYKIRPKKGSERGRAIRYASLQHIDLTFDNLCLMANYSDRRTLARVFKSPHCGRRSGAFLNRIRATRHTRHTA